jgi:membrane-bound serine protease (ClpP class)
MLQPIMMLAEETAKDMEAVSSPTARGVAAFALLALSLGMIVMEFLMPSMGLIALTSVGLAAGGAWIAYNIGPAWIIAYLLTVVAGVPVMIGVGVKAMKRSSMTIQGVQIPGGPPHDEGHPAKAQFKQPEAGERGTAETVLRPAGKARFGERVADVVAEGDFIEKGKAVRVMRVEGNTVMVREEK